MLCTSYATVIKKFDHSCESCLISEEVGQGQNLINYLHTCILQLNSVLLRFLAELDVIFEHSTLNSVGKIFG